VRCALGHSELLIAALRFKQPAAGIGSHAMCSTKDLHAKIAAYHDNAISDPHHRYRSWEHCYRFFRSRTREALAADKDTAALHLGFYLASWGMIRGSAFLLQKTYTIHVRVVEKLISQQFSELWEREIGTELSDEHLAIAILQLVLGGQLKTGH
jgi:hypothetical protein